MNYKRPEEIARTKKKILLASSNLFVKQGFAGTSISQIAKKAKVNQSLIYHYFSSKEELWKCVKEFFLNKAQIQAFDTSQSLREILTQIAKSRFDFYKKNPNVLRMMAWQRLEAKRNQLTGGNHFSPQSWKPIFAQLQRKGEIRKDVNLDHMILFFAGILAGAISEDHSNVLQSDGDCQLYLNMAVDNAARFFGK